MFEAVLGFIILKPITLT